MLQIFYSREFTTLPELKNDGAAMTLQEILESRPAKKTRIMRELGDWLKTALGKTTMAAFAFVQRLLLEFLKIADRGQIAGIAGIVLEPPSLVMPLQQTMDGVRAMIKILDHANSAKLRKKILQEIKEHVVEMVKNDSWLLLARMLDVIDDTAKTKKTILDQLLTEEAVEAVEGGTSNSATVFLAVLQPRDKRVFRPQHLEYLPKPVTQAELGEEPSDPDAWTCKKDATKRRNELLKRLLNDQDGGKQSLLDICAARAKLWLMHPVLKNVVISAAMVACEDSKYSGTEGFKKLKQAASKLFLDKDFMDGLGHRGLKLLAKNCEAIAAEFVEALDSYRDYLPILLETKGIFVLWG